MAAALLGPGTGDHALGRGAGLAGGPGRAVRPRAARAARTSIVPCSVPGPPSEPGGRAGVPGRPAVHHQRRRCAVRRPNGRPGQPFGRHQGVPLPAVVQTLSSSGTTGEPVMFALTRHRPAGLARRDRSGLLHRRDQAATTWSPTWSGCLAWPAGCRTPTASGASARRSPGSAACPPSGSSQLIPRLQATAVLSTTSFGTYLADRCQDLTGQDASALGVRTLLGGGEPGMGQPEIRDKIIRGWGLAPRLRGHGPRRRDGAAVGRMRG